MSDTKLCAVCGKPGKFQCSACKSVNYWFKITFLLPFHSDSVVPSIKSNIGQNIKVSVIRKDNKYLETNSNFVYMNVFFINPFP